MCLNINKICPILYPGSLSSLFYDFSFCIFTPIFENNLSNCLQINHYFTTCKISKHKRLAEHMDRSASEPLRSVTLLFKLWIISLLYSVLALQLNFTLTAFSRRFYPKRLQFQLHLTGTESALSQNNIPKWINKFTQRQMLSYPKLKLHVSAGLARHWN